MFKVVEGAYELVRLVSSQLLQHDAQHDADHPAEANHVFIADSQLTHKLNTKCVTIA